ncbi:tRNA synthetases class II core domain (F)-domain-containing protein [Cladochytrium replicatum]|nr:tRNA synthetases class II core domain (F)-domain-containing protein [Cladochytrium replicatum]
MSQESIQTDILTRLDTDGSIADTAVLPYASDLILGVLNSLLSKEILTYTAIKGEKWVLTIEGQEVASGGSPEVALFNLIPSDTGFAVADAQKQMGEKAKIAMSNAMSKKWLKKQGDQLVRAVDSVADQVQADLINIQETGAFEDARALQDYKRRKLVSAEKITSYSVQKGERFTTNVQKEATEITAEMLRTGEWKDQTFKKYNFNAEGIQIRGGHLHPLMKVREEFRQIFFELGFEEMPTNQFVESSFWNFDALFQPQQHPARDMHDTFFLKDPAVAGEMPKDYVERVKQVHSKGGYGSIGYGYDWKYTEAEKLILRTHTTAKEFRPVKYFSIDRVFRNETVDATHLAEFHQIEGVIADRGATLGDLIGILYNFFRKLGIEKLRFKPAYNPYTEPSLEIFSWHTGFKKWVEIGNSGMFRPEMLRPLGLPEDVSVIAWGLSLERPTMIKYSIDNIRELLGHKVDLEMVMTNPICRLDKKMGREI